MKATSSLTPSPPQLRPSSNTTEARTTPAIIPLDYNYQTMSPASSLSRNFFEQSQARSTGSTNVVSTEIEMGDSQFNSIFGDPVPPPPSEDFFGSQFPHAAEFLRRPSMIQLSSEEEVELSGGGRSNMRRLFSDVPYSSSISRRLSNVNYASRLQPPDIQILPHSSGDSSSEARDSPNYALLAPNDILRRPELYDIVEPADATELQETFTISDATGLREYSEATRRVSNFSEDFKSNVGSLGSPPPDVPELPKTYTRQFSNESCSSSEWFRPSAHGLPNFPEFTKMPRLRPSSKNVMSIKRDEMPMHDSPVAAMINDSNGSSSGEERRMDTTVVLDRATIPLPDKRISPMQQPDPSATYRYDSDMGLLLSPQQYLQQRRSSAVDGIEQNLPLPPAPPPLPPIPPPPMQEESLSLDVNDTPTLRCELSPAIIKDSIFTGGEFRVEQPRLHKKTSFTIISDKSPTPQDSRVQSPIAQHHKSQISPFLGCGFKDSSTASATSASIPRHDQTPQKSPRRKSISTTQLKLPQLRPSLLTSDDSPRPSVQFNMTGRRSPSKMPPHKGILQHREFISSLLNHDAPLSVSQIIPPKALPSSALAYGPRMKSCETLPLITDPYRTAIPRLNRSALDLRRESSVIPPGALPRPLRPNPNPTRKQRGLLRIINSADSSSRIPLRSKWSSMEDVTIEPGKRRPSLTPFSSRAERRRSSSTSPERRSSTQTASDRRSSNLSSVTTSDFSYRRPSLTPQPLRRKSMVPGSSPATKRRLSIAPPPATKAKAGVRASRSKIAKPTTLSPIIGTPNKDSSSPQSPAAALSVSETASDSVSRRGSISKIPVRNGVESRSNSRLSSHADSRHESRSSSPVKDLSGVQLPLSRPTSRAASSRSPSRATLRTESRASSHGTQLAAASRSTSRASTKPISRGGSRASSRQSSRMEQARSLANSRSNSRSNSRLSQSSVLKTGSVSLSPGPKRISSMRRRKSVSLSPKGSRRTVFIRRSSLSPERSKKGRSPEQQRRNSRSKIPMRAQNGEKSTLATKILSKSKQAPITTTPIALRRSPTQPSSVRGKEPASAKKAATSVRKPESSVKRTPSSVKKTPTDATKKPVSLQKTASRTSLRREASNVQKKSAVAAAVTTTTAVTKPLKKEASSLSLKKSGTTAETKRPPSVIRTVTTAAKATAIKKVISGGNKDSAEVGEAQTTATGISSAGTTKAETPKNTAPSGSKSEKYEVAGTDSGSSASTGSLKRQVTKLRLIRAGSKMSLLSRKRSDSNLSRKFDAETASIAEEIDIGTQSDKTSHKASEQLLSTNEDISTLPSAILEKSQKTLENVQKTVTEATDEIQKTITENLTDLKSLAETDINRTTTGGGGGGYESATSPSPSVTTVVENKAGKGASVSRIGTAEGVAAAKSSGSLTSPAITELKKSPAPPTQPIEAAVSVVNGARTSSTIGATNSQYATTSDTSLATAIGSQHLSPRDTDADLVERVSERAISVLPEVESESANFQSYEMGINDKTDTGVGGVDGIADIDPDADGSADAKRRSPDGQGGSIAESGDKTGSREYLEKKHKDDDNEDGNASKRTCCSCCTKLCMPCRRMRCSRCCRRKKSTSSITTASNNNNDDDARPVLTPPSSAATTTTAATNLEVVDEKQQGCWQKLNCCKRKKKKSTRHEAELVPSVQHQQQQQPQMETIHEEETPTPEVSQLGSATAAKQSSKCGLCLSKFFCCRSVNKVKTTTSGGGSMMHHARDEPKVGKCCFCIPWRRKRPRGSTVGSMSSGAAAWQDPERGGITSTDASVLEGVEAVEPRPGCCRRFWCCLSCCKKKPPAAAISDSRRASMKAATPAEDTRRKLHVDLVEYSSKMKGAIPVLPLYLAWFCAICNTVFPGLGTLLSGIFCVCIGIPRFSHYDSAKARLGALIINTIVAVSQFFCVLFCFVGWGWSIWWGTIMLRCAKKFSKIRKVERLEMEEEQRQSDQAAAIAATVATRAVLASEIEAAKQ